MKSIKTISHFFFILVSLTLFVRPTLSTAIQNIDSSLHEENGLPAFLHGTWIVSEVNVKRTGQYDSTYNDPIYLGRTFTFAPSSIQVNTPNDDKCSEHIKTIVKPLSINKLLSQSIDPNTTPEDYNLKIPEQTQIKVYQISCNGGLWYGGLHGWNTNPEIDGAWLLQLPQNKLAVRWEGNDVLILAKLEPGTKPTPSFDCAKANRASEKAICESVGLALYDVSVNKAYKAILDTKDKNKIARLKKTQKAWMAKRDACGSDQACLQKEMYFRLLDMDAIRTDADIEEPKIPLCEPNCK